MNYKTIVTLAKKVKEYVEKNHTFPRSIVINSKTINYGLYAYYFSNFIVNGGKQVADKTVKNSTKDTGNTIKENVYQGDYKDQAKRVAQYIKQNGKAPSYVSTVKSKKTVKASDYCYAFAKIVVFYSTHTRFPNTCLYDSSIYTSKSAPKVIPNEVYNHFVKTFGSITDFDSALRKIDGKGYGHYYNGKLTNKQVINNLKNGGQKPNCTDISQMLWWIAKALRYDVKAVHMRCKSGEGHIYLKLRHPVNTEGSWIARDGACVISDNGRPITCVWCADGKLIDVNPSWFLESLSK